DYRWCARGHVGDIPTSDSHWLARWLFVGPSCIAALRLVAHASACNPEPPQTLAQTGTNCDWRRCGGPHGAARVRLCSPGNFWTRDGAVSPFRARCVRRSALGVYAKVPGDGTRLH